MIDHTLVISPWGAPLFHLKQGFFLYVWPMLIGFVTILGYQSLGRIGMMGTVKWPVVFGLGCLVSMISLFGWVMMARGIQMIPFYGCGFGLASAMMSRIYAVIAPVHPRLKMRIPRVIWRGDTDSIAKLKEALRARAAACQPGRDPTV
jgi:hypothetical protein